MTAQDPVLQQLKSQLERHLESQMQALLTQMESTRVLTAELAQVQRDIERQKALATRLTERLTPLRDEEASLRAEVQGLEDEVQSLMQTIATLKATNSAIRAQTGSSEA